MKKKYPIPPEEKDRLDALHSYEILDTLPEEDFNALTQLASHICQTPIALITLLDEERQWFKAKVGLDVPETPRYVSFCQHAIMNDGLYEVTDAAEDDVFKNTPLVTGQPYIRFYAGIPLKTPEGFNLGTLCVIDRVPRQLSEEQKIALKNLSRQVIAQLELRKKNSLLVRSRHELNNFFNKSLDLLCIASTDGFFKKINPAFHKILGYSEHELLNKPFTSFIHPDDIEATLKEVDKLARGIETVGFVNRYRTKKGDYKWLSWQASPDSKTGLLYADARNISEQKQSEQKLIWSEEKFRSIFENSQSGLCTHDMNGVLLSMNYAGSDMLGYEPEELTGKSVCDLLAKDTRHLFEKYLHEVKTNKMSKGLMKVVTKRGDEKIWAYKNILMNDIDGSEYVLGNATDITESYEVERQFKLAIKFATEASLAKDSFLANMSHEIRTPMNVIIGFTELLSQTSLNPFQKESVESIKVAGENLLSIINDILDFSKMETGKLTIESYPFNLRETLQNMYNLLKVKAQEKSLEYHLLMANDLPDYVMGDGNRLNQVLINLVGNAIKFTEKGSVIITVKKIAEDEQQCELHFSIKDTGIGIPEDKLDVIFERFTQGDVDISRKFGGTGLGLNIAKSLIELQKGRLKVISDPGKGSEFYFKIPYQKATELNVKSITIPVRSPLLQLKRSAKVLLCEDNILNQRLMKNFILNLGFEIEIAGNGKEGIALLKKNKYDLVLMDLQMPEIDGYQTTKIIRNELKLKVPIIAMTAHSMMGEKDKCLAIGMNAYIAKPFRQDEFYQTINSVLMNKPVKQQKTKSVKQSKPTKSPIDLGYLKGLSGGNLEFEKEILELFVRQIPGEIELLTQAIESNKYAETGRLAHKIKSSVAAIGIKNLKNSFISLEEDSKNKSFTINTKDNIKKIIGTLNECYPLLKKMLKTDYAIQ